MSQTKFRHPSEMVAPEERTPVSARVKVVTKEALEEEAKKHGLSLGLLVANVLDDYADWLESHSVKSKKSI